jgi:hypothetical protein
MDYVPFLNIEYFFYKVYSFFVHFSGEGFVAAVREWMIGIQGISFFVSVLLACALVYAVEKLKVIRKAEEEFYTAKAEPAFVEGGVDPRINDRWERVKKHLDSENPNEWMLAIIEADIILFDLLRKMGYQGDGVGEMLKRVEKGDMTSLDNAWEAHKVRNAIAHQGADYVVGQREAKRVVNLYRSVFEEFQYI